MIREAAFVCWIVTTAVIAEDAAVVDLAARVNCSDSNSVYSTGQKCMDLYSVPFTQPSPDFIQNVSSTGLLQLMDSNTTANLCRPENRENFIKGSQCSAYIAMTCTDGSPILQSSVPSAQEVRRQIETLCNGGYSQECVMDRAEYILNCVNSSHHVIGDYSDYMDPHFVDRILCENNAVNGICARKHLKPCGETAIQIYELSNADPDVCQNFTGDFPRGKEIDCSNTRAMRMSYLACQVNAGAFIPLPVDGSSDQISQYIQGIVAIQQDQEMCRNLSQSIDLLNCTLTVQRQCSSDSLKTPVPDSQAVVKGLQQLCNNESVGIDPAVATLATLINCTDTNFTSSAMQKCQDLYGVKAAFPEIPENPSNLTAAVLTLLNSHEMAELCRPDIRENFIKGQTCTFYIFDKCTKDTGTQTMMPSSVQLRQQIHFVCDGGFNQSCIISKIEEMEKCTNISQSVIGDDLDFMDPYFIERLFCESDAITKLCTRKHLRPCGETAVHDFELFLVRSDNCENYTGAIPGSEGANVDCNNKYAMRLSYLSCQVNSGIFIQLPEKGSRDEIGRYITSKVFKDPEMCRTFSESTDLLNCTLSVQSVCGSDPDADFVLEVFQQMCKINHGIYYQSTFNFSCL